MSLLSIVSLSSRYLLGAQTTSISSTDAAKCEFWIDKSVAKVASAVHYTSKEMTEIAQMPQLAVQFVQSVMGS